MVTLLLATGPLWFGGSNFPAVPLFGGLWVAPAAQRLISMATVACLILLAMFAHKDHFRFALALIVTGLFVGLVQLNQHRLQPWLLHLTILIAVLAIRKPNTPHTAIRWITAGIYFHSAISKLDYDFLTGGGLYLVKALGTVLHLTPETWPGRLQTAAIAGLPTFEFIVAILLISRAKRLGWICTAAMHIGLLTALVQLNHKPAVLIWNAWFVLQAMYCLAIESGGVVPAGSDGKNSKTLAGHAVAAAAIGIVWVLPMLNYEPTDIWDNWPSWALYSTRSERISVFVPEELISHLPPTVQKFVAPPSPILCRIKVDRWSLEQTGAPIYPEDRFWAAVALHLAAEADSKQTTNTRTRTQTQRRTTSPETSIHVQIESKANRFSGKRKSVRLMGHQQLLDYTSRFWLNAIPQTLQPIDRQPPQP